VSPPRHKGASRHGVRNARLVRERDRVQTRQLLLALAAGLVVLVPLMGNIWGHAEAVRLGYRLEEARKTRDALLEVNRLLRTEHASQRRLSRIQERAIRELGLMPRDPAATVVVSVVGSPDERDPAPATDRELVVAEVLENKRDGDLP
jgi:cell division protein FtsL